MIECLRRNDDSVDVENVMSSHICNMPDSLFIEESGHSDQCMTGLMHVAKSCHTGLYKVIVSIVGSNPT